MSKKVKILLVEDDTFLREIILKKLSSEGFEVVEAEDGEKALLAAEKDVYDVILLDLIIPVINGFEVLEKVRSLPDKQMAGVPIFVLSNLGEEDDIKKAMDLGANDYLVKAHFTTDEIVEKIKKELGI